MLYAVIFSKLGGLLLINLFEFDAKLSNISKLFFLCLWSVCEQKSASEMDGSFDGLQITMPLAAQLYIYFICC